MAQWRWFIAYKKVTQFSTKTVSVLVQKEKQQFDCSKEASTKAQVSSCPPNNDLGSDFVSSKMSDEGWRMIQGKFRNSTTEISQKEVQCAVMM